MGGIPARALANAFEISGALENARKIYAEILDQCRSCHTRIDPFIKRKFADISFDLGHNSTAILEMYLSLGQEDPGNAAYYFHRVARIYSSMGNEEEARRFKVFAQQAKNENQDASMG